METLTIALLAVAGVAGFALVPLIAFTIGPSLPGFLAEPLASALFVVGMMGVGRGKLVQTDTGNYEIRRVSPDELESHEPRSYWSKWAMAPFAIAFEKTPEAFDRLRASRSTVEEVRSLVPSGAESRAEWDRERGGERAYVDTSVSEDAMLIPTGEALTRVGGDGGTELGIESVQEALKEHGGDTSAYSPKIMLVGVVTMALMGLGMGYVVFF